MRRTYLHGTGVLVGAQPGAGQYLVLHVKNPEGLVAKEKGTGTAWAVMSLIPNTVTNTIYKTIGEEMRKQFIEKGSDVDIQIVDTAPSGSRPKADLVTGMVLGAGLLGAILGVVKLVRR